MNNAEIVGLIGTCVILFSLFQTSTVKLRAINIVGSILMVIYGLWIGALSVWVLNSMCALISIIRLYQHTNNRNRARGGCVVIGYPGVGKSTASERHVDYIDLESSASVVKGKRFNYWYLSYCEYAYELAKQGYVVFISSHRSVQKYMSETHRSAGVDVYVCFPELSLQDKWVNKLNKRYLSTGSDKDYAAWFRASTLYEQDITSLQSSVFPSIVIDSMKYDLDFMIEALR